MTWSARAFVEHHARQQRPLGHQEPRRHAWLPGDEPEPEPRQRYVWRPPPDPAKVRAAQIAEALERDPEMERAEGRRR
jgi:hypothetical protein